MKRLAFALVMLAGAAAADEPVRHVVTSGESCASIAQRYYGDARFVDVLHGANPELAAKPPPHLLREGMVLVIPPKPTTSDGPGAARTMRTMTGDAELTAVRNRVQVLAPEPKQGKPNDPLFRGNRVSTEDASAADVTFRDETQVKLGERTLVVILGDARAAAARVTTETTLVTGSLRAFMASARPGTGANVATDAAKVRVYDGEAQVSADTKKTTRLAVYRGSGAIEAGGRTREVARGFGSKAELGKPPTEPRPLPPAPVWSATPPLVLRDTGKGALIAGEYAAAPSPVTVAEWHVQIARDGIFRDVAVDTRVPADVTKLEGHVPTSGRYYVRVSGRDDDGFEGAFSPIARTLVIQATKTDLANGERSIAIDPSDAFCVRVGNVPLTRLEGQAIVVPRSEPVRVRCAPSKTDPTTLLSIN